MIDAAQLGNKTRFMNHAANADDGLNCEAKIMLVNGEHRIKFTALRDIREGEELLFNYGEKFAEKQGLNKTLPKAGAGSKRGVLEGADALDALDGMDPRKRGTREKMDAIRGGKATKQVRGGRMRKSALHPRPAVEADVEEEEEEESYMAPEDDEEEEEEDEDEDVEDSMMAGVGTNHGRREEKKRGRGRPRRQITGPNHYRP